MENLKTFQFFTSHNSASYTNPSIISKSGTEVIFSFESLSIELKEKLYGVIGIVNLTFNEAMEVYEAAVGTRTVGKSTLNNLFS